MVGDRFVHEGVLYEIPVVETVVIEPDDQIYVRQVKPTAVNDLVPMESAFVRAMVARYQFDGRRKDVELGITRAVAQLEAITHKLKQDPACGDCTQHLRSVESQATQLNRHIEGWRQRLIGEGVENYDAALIVTDLWDRWNRIGTDLAAAWALVNQSVRRVADDKHERWARMRCPSCASDGPFMCTAKVVIDSNGNLSSVLPDWTDDREVRCDNCDTTNPAECFDRDGPAIESSADMIGRIAALLNLETEGDVWAPDTNDASGWVDRVLEDTGRAGPAIDVILTDGQIFRVTVHQLPNVTTGRVQADDTPHAFLASSQLVEGVCGWNGCGRGREAWQHRYPVTPSAENEADAKQLRKTFSGDDPADHEVTFRDDHPLAPFPNPWPPTAPEGD